MQDHEELPKEFMNYRFFRKETSGLPVFLRDFREIMITTECGSLSNVFYVQTRDHKGIHHGEIVHKVDGYFKKDVATWVIEWKDGNIWIEDILWNKRHGWQWEHEKPFYRGTLRMSENRIRAVDSPREGAQAASRLDCEGAQ